MKNKLGITTQAALEAAEREITALTHLRIRLIEPPYDLQTLKSLHQQLFYELYDWAGAIRSVDISKGNTRFCTNGRIEAESASRFRALSRDEWLQGLGHDEFCRKLAEHYCEMNMIHPFREGNGRVQRLLFEHLSLSAGYNLDWGQVGPDEWLRANVAGVQADYDLMYRIFDRLVSP